MMQVYRMNIERATTDGLGQGPGPVWIAQPTRVVRIQIDGK